jgi:hypothetical protein
MQRHRVACGSLSPLRRPSRSRGRMHKRRARCRQPALPRCSHAIGAVTALALYRLPGRLTAATQLTPGMLAKTRRTSKRPNTARHRGSGSGDREPAARSAPTARGSAPTTTSGRRAPPARTRSSGPSPARRRRTPVTGPTRTRASHRGSVRLGTFSEQRAGGCASAHTCCESWSDSGRATSRRRWSASTPSHNQRRSTAEMTETGVTLAARGIPVEMVTKPLSVFATHGRLPYRQRQFAAYRIGVRSSCWPSCRRRTRCGPCRPSMRCRSVRRVGM